MELAKLLYCLKCDHITDKDRIPALSQTIKALRHFLIYNFAFILHLSCIENAQTGPNPIKVFSASFEDTLKFQPNILVLRPLQPSLIG